ncbi:MAG: fatty acid desaturase [Alphaproteobacteria bacterium]|nr:fatty acid desaturase [Alphaproteobacteria bacterium]
MTTVNPTASPPLATDIKPQDWPRILMPYSKPDNRRAGLEFTITLIPFLALWALAAWATSVSYWLTLLISIPAAAFLTRLFIFQHDCGHRACFESRTINDFLGRLLGVITLTPYAMWQRNHAVHHAISGDLGRRRDSDIRTLTVVEYQALSPVSRLLYRLYRNPFTLFVFGPFWVFFIRYRLPIDARTATRRDWFSTMGSNLALVALILGLGWVIGIDTVLMVHAPIVFLTASFGVWLFYVQHQFEKTIWEDSEKWNLQAAALYGSSHYRLPAPLRWFSGNIGIHHVHHLSSRVPFYRLPEVLRDHPQLDETSSIGLRESLSCAWLALWDEQRKRLVRFNDIPA